jgi:DNA-binding NtrC family response regulator
VGRALKEFGYAVAEANNGKEALAWLAEAPPPALVVTDLVMPEMGGREMAAELVKRHPDLPVLFTSGYTDNEAVRRELVRENHPFLQKPLTPDTLLRTIRDVLDRN